MLTFREHHTVTGDKNLHGEDLLSIAKWAAMQNKKGPLGSSEIQPRLLVKVGIKKSGRSIMLT